MDLQKLILEIEQQIVVKASLPKAFEGLRGPQRPWPSPPK